MVATRTRTASISPPPADGGRPVSDATVSLAGDGERVRSMVVKAASEELDAVEIACGPAYGPGPHTHESQVDSFYILEGELEFTPGDEVGRQGPARSCLHRRASSTGSRASATLASSTCTPRRVVSSIPSAEALDEPESPLRRDRRRPGGSRPERRAQPDDGHAVHQVRRQDGDRARVERRDGLQAPGSGRAREGPRARRRQALRPGRNGRPFKEWVQVPYAHANEWAGLADTAIRLRAG